MRQVNGVIASSLARVDRIERRQQRPQRSERRTDTGTALANRTLDNETVGKPVPPPQTWPRIFPSL